VSCRFHDLRHTTVTRLLEKGAAFATVAVVMGWSAGTAMKMAKRYSHIGKSAQREALALLDPVVVGGDDRAGNHSPTPAIEATGPARVH
jgi:integrase